MTATTTTEVACPKCGAAMFDNRLTKKNPKQPDFKCTRYKEGCEGVIWPPKNAPPQKVTVIPPKPRLTSNVPDSALPPLLQNAEKEDAAELAAKIGGDLAEQEAFALYKRAAKFVTQEIAPLYEKSGVGMSPESAAASVQTLFINLTGGKK